MGRRLPRHTARKSTGERRLPDKTNNARDRSEDGSEEVRGKRPSTGGGGGVGGQPPEDDWPAVPCNNSLRLDIEDSHASKKGEKLQTACCCTDACKFRQLFCKKRFDRLFLGV
jgi:hypothetical protein